MSVDREKQRRRQWLNTIIERVRTAEGVNSDRELAEPLKVGERFVSSAKAKGSIPWPQLYAWASWRGISLEWLFNGRGPMWASDLDEHDAEARMLPPDPDAPRLEAILATFLRTLVEARGDQCLDLPAVAANLHIVDHLYGATVDVSDMDSLAGAVHKAFVATAASQEEHGADRYVDTDLLFSAILSAIGGEVAIKAVEGVSAEDIETLARDAAALYSDAVIRRLGPEALERHAAELLDRMVIANNRYYTTG